MANLRVTSIFLAVAVVVTHAAAPNRPRPESPTLGAVLLPNFGASGWGWPATEAPPTGWPATEAPGWSAPPTTGWPSPGWPAPVGPIDIEMAAEAAVLGAGEAGATHGSQTIVTGDSSNPAIASIQAGSYSSLAQGSSTYQVSSISNTGEGDSFMGIDTYNFGDAGEYNGVGASGNTIQSANGGASFVVGQGAIGQGGLTENSNPNVK